MKRLLFAFLITTHVVMAAPPDPPTPQPYTVTPPPPPPPGLTIGSEIWLLLAIAIIFSYFKLKPFFKQKTSM